jgi:lipopolysaccharide transport system ATP-binding protein
MRGEIEKVTKTYLNNQLKVISSSKKWNDIKKAPGTDEIRLLDVFAHNINGEIKGTFEVDEPVGISFRFQVFTKMEPFTHGFTVFNESEVVVFSSHDLKTEIRHKMREPGIYEVTGWIPEHFMAEGNFRISVATFNYDGKSVIHFYEHETVAFTIVDYIKGNSARGRYPGAFPGVIRPLLNWTATSIK